MTQNLTLYADASIQVVTQLQDQLNLKSFTRLYFDVMQEHSVSIQNQISDNYIEDNTAIQDQIAHSPLIVTVRGLSGELVYTAPTRSLNWLYGTVNDKIQSVFNNSNPGNMANTNILTDKLTVIPALLPPVDNITQAAKNTVQYVEASVQRYIKIFKNFTSDRSQRLTRLQQIYNDISQLRATNTLFTVETPYGEFYDMAILSVALRQGNENYITDVEMTLKQINFATTQTTKPDTNVMSAYNAYARTQEANHGKAQGKLVSIGKDILNNNKWLGATEGSGIRR